MVGGAGGGFTGLLFVFNLLIFFQVLSEECYCSDLLSFFWFFLGPGGIYPELGRAFTQQCDGLALQVDYRRPNHMSECVEDVLASINFISKNYEISSNFILVGMRYLSTTLHYSIHDNHRMVLWWRGCN